jgi:hypothetical protein
MGKIKYRNEDKYKGGFKDGRPSGFGELRYLNTLEGMNNELESGDYKGEWKCGKRHGKGTMKWDDGSSFEGIWNADHRVSGIMKMTNGMVNYIIFNRYRFILAHSKMIEWKDKIVNS